MGKFALIVHDEYTKSCNMLKIGSEADAIRYLTDIYHNLVRNGLKCKKNIKSMKVVFNCIEPTNYYIIKFKEDA